MSKVMDYTSNYKNVLTEFETAVRQARPGELVEWPSVLHADDCSAIVRKVQEERADAEARETTFCPLEDLVVPPVRVQILNEGAKITNGARNVSYGEPSINLAAAGELKAVFRKHMSRAISSAELEAIDMVLTKLGRVATGPMPIRDTYVDGSTYFAIAGEIALTKL